MISRRHFLRSGVLLSGAAGGVALAGVAGGARALSLEAPTPEVESALRGACQSRRVHASIEEEIAMLLDRGELSEEVRRKLREGNECPLCGQRLAAVCT
ncbi:MAG: hypothetical protein KIT81_09125 [Alphaproteobacteria bacterium]|nr:hypothetical protein [Alphaproteobacteria bacterium]